MDSILKVSFAHSTTARQQYVAYLRSLDTSERKDFWRMRGIWWVEEKRRKIGPTEVGEELKGMRFLTGLPFHTTSGELSKRQRLAEEERTLIGIVLEGLAYISRGWDCYIYYCRSRNSIVNLSFGPSINYSHSN